MPVILSHNNHHDMVALWQITKEEFSAREQGNSIQNLQNQRQRQKLACLSLANLYTGGNSNIFYDVHGKPHLANDPRNISFSHSGEYAAMMLSDRHAGIDFEMIRAKVLNITHKFLNENELESLHEIHRVEHAHIYWGAKESLYKVYGKQQLSFRENLLIEPFPYESSKGYFKAAIVTESNRKNFTLYYEQMFGYMLVYVVNS